jgi:predicted DNA repair protein MutK
MMQDLNLIKKVTIKVFSKLGHLLVKALPIIIKLLGVVGTIALILVAGGIFLTIFITCMSYYQLGRLC